MSVDVLVHEPDKCRVPCEGLEIGDPFKSFKTTCERQERQREELTRTVHSAKLAPTVIFGVLTATPSNLPQLSGQWDVKVVIRVGRSANENPYIRALIKYAVCGCVHCKVCKNRLTVPLMQPEMIASRVH